MLLGRGKTRASRALLVATLIAALLPGGDSRASAGPLLTWSGVVTNVIDGDTFDIDLDSGGAQTIRIAGLNTNETSHDPKCWADEATSRLSNLVMGERVELRARDASSSALGRKVRHVFLGSRNVGATMLEEGYGVPLVFVGQEPDYADAYIRAFWNAHDQGLRIHDPTGCGSGPHQDAELDLVTIGDADGTDSENLNGEYVDIVNRGGTTVPIGGWSLHDSAVGYYTIPAGTSLGPGDRVRVHVGSGTDTESDLFMGFSAPIFSSHDGAFLLDIDEDIRAFDYWPCHGRCGPPEGDLVISDVVFDGPGNDDADPNVETLTLRNTSPDPIDLADWRLESWPYLLHFTSRVITPGQEVTVHVGQGSDTSTKVYWGKTKSILNNDGDRAHLITPHGDVNDCLAWGSIDCSDKPSLVGPGPDFNGDGYDDLAVGVPGEAIGTKSDAGVANIQYGSISGLTTAGNHMVRQGAGYPGAAEAGDRLGDVLTWGDFDGDGYDDLVLGSPGEDIGSTVDSGMIMVIPGGRYSLDKSRARARSQWGPVPGASEKNDRFGASLASGDFDGDGHDDLAVGVPDEDIGSKDSAGAVIVLMGSASGITTSGHMFSQSGPIPGTPEPGDRFGAALASGDFDGDGYDDLAIGAPGEDLGSTQDAGVVAIVFGSATGLSLASSVSRSQSGAIPGSPERGDAFGHALATGDTNRDGYDELVIGSPGERVEGKDGAGFVVILKGSSAGLSASGLAISQAGTVPGSPETNDRFGHAVHVGDMNGDGYSDLLTGSPGEGLAGVPRAGAVIAIFGSSGGLTTSGGLFFGSPVFGRPHVGDGYLGSSALVADFDGDGFWDGAVGVPGGTVGSRSKAGWVGILHGGASVSGSGATDQGPLVGSPEATDEFGYVSGS